MKKIGVVFVTLVMIGFMAGCGGTPPPAPAANQPDWADEVPPDDVLWGIGIAKQSSPAMSRTTAEARGRVSIARTLDTSVKAMFTDYNRDAGTADSQQNVSLQEDVSRQITSIQLNGARLNKSWTAPDGTVWIRMEYSKADAKASLNNIINNEAAQFAEFKTDQALALLDNELAKNQKPSPVNDQNAQAAPAAE